MQTFFTLPEFVCYYPRWWCARMVVVRWVCGWRRSTRGSSSASSPRTHQLPSLVSGTFSNSLLNSLPKKFLYIITSGEMPDPNPEVCCATLEPPYLLYYQWATTSPIKEHHISFQWVTTSPFRISIETNCLVLNLRNRARFCLVSHLFYRIKI